MLISIRDLDLPIANEMIERASAISGRWDNWIENSPGDRSSRAPGIHASELSCIRRVVYSIVNMPKKGVLRKVWRQKFFFGHAVHDMIQTDFEKLAAQSEGRIEFTREVQISPEKQALAAELNLHSHCDGIFTFFDVHDNGERTPVIRLGLEIKTDAPDSYEKLTKPKPEHIVQGHVYMKLLDLPLMWFLYVNKANQNNTPSSGEFLVKFDEKIWNNIEKRCNTALNYAAAYEHTQELPLREEGIHCDFCPYSYTCNPKFTSKRGASKFRTLK